jgi:hypothetical protein
MNVGGDGQAYTNYKINIGPSVFVKEMHHATTPGKAA